MSDAYDKFVRGVHATLLVLAVLLLTLMCLWLWHLDIAARELGPTITDLHRTVLVIGGASTNLEKTLAEERHASINQIAAAQNATDGLRMDEKELAAFLRSTNESLNAPETGLLPRLSIAVRRADTTGSKLAESVRSNLADLDAAEQQLGPAIEHFNSASAALAEQLPPILENVKDTTAQTVTIAENTASTTHQIDLTSQDIRAFVHRETAPVRGTWNVIKGFLFQIAGPASSVAQAAK